MPDMKIVITGGGGFIGFKLAKALLARGTLAAEKIARLTLVDQAFPADLPEDPRLATLAGDISDPGFAARAIATDTTSIFHLAAVVSGAAEADFDLGMRVNLQGMRNVLEQARRVFDAAARPPRLVFASSVAAVLSSRAVIAHRWLNCSLPTCSVHATSMVPRELCPNRKVDRF